jgi:glycerate 2-kinase
VSSHACWETKRVGALINKKDQMEKSFALHLAIIQSALAAADPKRLFVERVIRRGGELLFGGERLSVQGPGLVVGLGKAAGPMISGARELLRGVPCEWLCVTKDLHPTPEVGPLHRSNGEGARRAGEAPILFAGHPVPDERSVFAAETILQKTKKLSEAPDSWLLLLLSGGASALACAPVEGVTLQEKQALSRSLLASGLEISDCNVVRGALSRFKAGGLLRALGDVPAVCAVLSDVIAGGIFAVGSGPLSPPSTEKNAKEILIKSGVWQTTPRSIRAVLERPTTAPERLAAPHFLLGDRQDLLAGARREIEARGYRVVIQNDSFSGSAEQLITLFSSAIGALAPKSAAIVVGEPTLAVTAGGTGGRAQHIALSLARLISGDEALSFAACGSDGTDGPTDAAGAIVDGRSWDGFREAGVDPEQALQGFDSYRAHSAAGSLLRLGPTGTNVNDLYILVRDES